MRRIPGAPDRRRRPRETVETQTTRFGGEFERLSRTLDDIEAGVDIAAEPNRIVPDRVLVLELKNSVQNFAREARRLGFAWMLEQGADGNDNVSDEEDLVDPAVAADPRLYALMPSREALQTLLRLWTAFTAQEPAPQGYGKWWQIFATLNVIRSWSAEDRIDQWTRTILQDQIRRNPTGAVRIEFDLWFREDPIVRLARMEAFQAKVAAADGRVLDRVLLEPIQYHAALVELPVRQALALIERAGPLATADEVMVVRPQSFSPHPPSERDPLEAVDRAPPTEPDTRAPIAALLDGFPIENHDLLRNRIDVYPIDVAPAEAPSHRRMHGTQMASLVIHGDLDGGHAPLGRTLLVVPVLASPANGSPEHTPTDKLAVGMIERAVRALKEGVGGREPVGPDVLIINHSLGDMHSPFERRASHWSRLLDYLSHRYNVLFIVSAGNAQDGLPLDGFANLADFGRATADARTEAILTALERARATRPVLSPAQSCNSLTVGALHSDFAGPGAFTGAAIDPFGTLRMTNLGSRLGTGIGGSIKPDLVMPGGRQAARARVTPSGLEVFSQEIEGVGQRAAIPDTRGGRRDRTQRSSGTSNAAALATRDAIRIAEALDDIPPVTGEVRWRNRSTRAVILKCLLAHGCSWGDIGHHLDGLYPPAAATSNYRRRVAISQFLGYGEPDVDRVISGSAHRVTMLADATLRNDRRHEYRIPLPDSLSSLAELRRITVTLAWSSPVRVSAASPRSIRLVVTDDEGKSHFWEGVDRTNVVQPDHRHCGKGTLFHSVLDGRKAVPFRSRSSFMIGVQAMAETTAFNQVDAPYALAVSFETADTIRADIYQEIRQELELRARAGVAVRARRS